MFIFALTGFISLSAQIYEPVKWNFTIKNTGKGTADVVLIAMLEKGWHLYGLNIPPDGPRPTSIIFDKIENAEKSGTLKAVSKLHEEYDSNFDMKLNWYVGEAKFIQGLKYAEGADVKVSGYVEFMACNDENCLPPRKEKFELAIPGTNKNTVAATSEKPAVPVVQIAPVKSDSVTIAEKPEKATVADYWTPVINELRAFGEEHSNNAALWLIFLAGMAGGFLALFTPCVWPIIPMTVSFFLKRSENKRKGRRDAVFYGVAIIIIYVTLGILITLIFGPSALNSMSTNAVFNLIFFAMLILFAVSFFGAFEITLPASWSTKMDARADSTAGFISILFMAFTLVLVSFSCTGPIIGTTLVEVASSGNIIGPAVAMFGFALALAIPFTFFAFFPSLLKSMPKSGGWLNTVKVVLAFLELALSLKFLSVADLAYGWHILDRETFLALWIVIFALLGFYLLGKIRFPHDSESHHSSVLGTFLAIISLAFAVYMVPGLWGAPLKAISAFSPPLYTQDFNLYHDEVHPAFNDYDEGMKYAKEKGLPVLVDFTGYGCVNCRKMEAAVWTAPAVKDKLQRDFVLISVYVDDKTKLSKPVKVTENGKEQLLETVGDKWSYLQRSKFGANAQPFYVILDNNGKPLNHSYSYKEDVDAFVSWLETGEKSYKVK